MSKLIKFAASISIFLFPVLKSIAQKNSYINKNRNLAKELSKNYGIPASVILGVAIIESGAGKSRNARLLNNHFGIKGKNSLSKTHPHMRSLYKQYANVSACYADFCKIISRKRLYKRLKGNLDYKPWVEQISKCGYTEVPLVWKTNIISAIKKLRLHRVDLSNQQ
jgi:flagellum-specific peptidoglycan hydrolase FlgJ